MYAWINTRLLHGVTDQDKSFFSEVEWYDYQKEFIRKAVHQPDFKLENQSRSLQQHQILTSSIMSVAE